MHGIQGSYKLGIRNLAEILVDNLFCQQLILDIKYATSLSISGILRNIWGMWGIVFRVYWYTTPLPFLIDPRTWSSRSVTKTTSKRGVTNIANRSDSAWDWLKPFKLCQNFV